MDNKTVALVMVTYNRLDLLKGAMETIFNQTDKLDGIFIVNNDSTDGTEEYLETLTDSHDNVHVKNLKKNIGGAGGFNEGIKFAYQFNDYDFYWLMDDDTYPKENALDSLLKADKKIDGLGFLSSNVLWTDGNPVVMNVPTVSAVWNSKVEDGLVGLSSASFVSMLISKEAIHKCGLPIKEFFIWGDDVEYSHRISKKFSCFFVSDSTVIHEMKANSGVDILTENGDRVNRHYYDTRNRFYMAKQEGIKSTFKYVLNRTSMMFKIMFSNSESKFKKIKVMLHGLWSGIFFDPKIEYLKSTNKN